MTGKYFITFIIFLIVLRLMELFMSSRNAKWLTSNGAVEYGQKHYPFMVSMHTLFIVSLLIEHQFKYGDAPAGGPVNMVLLFTFIAVLAFKFWTLSTLGVYWTTKIYRIPNSEPITSGPYRFVRHPNYMEVIAELLIAPLIFHLYFTLILFTVLNAWMLSVRIKEENRIWQLQA